MLNIAFGEPTIAVDTHIFRVANRTGLAPGKDVAEVERRLMKFVPDEFRRNAHHWLILHGRYICMARDAAVLATARSRLCEYRHKTPAPKPRAKARPPAAEPDDVQPLARRSAPRSSATRGTSTATARR